MGTCHRALLRFHPCPVGTSRGFADLALGIPAPGSRSLCVTPEQDRVFRLYPLHLTVLFLNLGAIVLTAAPIKPGPLSCVFPSSSSANLGSPEPSR